jgi:hypothetical protein
MIVFVAKMKTASGLRDSNRLPVGMGIQGIPAFVALPEGLRHSNLGSLLTGLECEPRLPK